MAQRLKPNGRLFIIDFLNDDGLDNFFGKIHDHQAPASHTVVHKHGWLFDISHTHFSDDVHCLSIGFSSEQMIDMLKAAGLQNPQVQVTTQRIVHSY